MKVIFLDIDGVLQPYNSNKRFKKIMIFHGLFSILLLDFKIKNFYHNRQINLTFAEIFVKYFGKNA